MIRLSVLLCMIFTFYTNLNAQEWVEKFQNTDKYTFQEVQQSFEAYWKDRKITRSNGYKPFKRWEHHWESRLMDDGKFPAAGLAQQRFADWSRTYATNSSQRTINWEPLGPSTTTGGYNGLGRINAVAFHPTNTNKIYAGAAGGGLWISDDGGNSWVTTTDNLGTIGISSIYVNPSNPDVVYIATGDADAANNYSIGVLKSTDGGLTFNPTGLSFTTSQNRLIHKILASPSDPNYIVAGTTNGIYYSSNGGTSWTNRLSGTRIYDVEVSPGAGSQTWHAATSSGIQRSVNNGDTWAESATFTTTNRVALAVTPADNTVVYALLSHSSGSYFRALYKSTTTGASYTIQSTTPNILGYSEIGDDTDGQGTYDLNIAADPTNANKVYIGGVNCWKSTNSGVNWSLVSHWSGAAGVQTVHADKHALEWQGNVLWEGNDGGLYSSSDGGVNWINKSNGMAISQIYKVAVAQIGSGVLAGFQDNGAKLYTESAGWTNELGGDAMEVAISPSNPNLMYAEYYYGEIERSTDGGASWTNIYGNIPGAPSGAWVTPFVIDPANHNKLYMGFNDVYRSTNQGTTFTAISTSLSPAGKLTYLAVAHSDTNTIYAGRSSAMFKTNNGGTTWTTVTTPGTSTNMIAVHPTQPNTVYAVRGSYSSGKVYKSIDGGATWTNISYNLPAIPANCIVYENGTNEGLYVGMDVGIYYIENGQTSWTLINTGLPNVEITKFEIKYSEGKIYASTYGRGIWKSDLISQANACPKPTLAMVDSIIPTAVKVKWNAIAPVPTATYQYVVNQSQLPPATGPFATTTDTAVWLTNLIATQDYYCHVRTECGEGNTSLWTSVGPFSVPKSCGDISYDSGGPDNNYDNNESTTATICPGTSAEKITLTFTQFAVESGWDALYIHNGTSINAPLMASNNGATQAGFPAGGYYGSSIPGPFSATNSTGCLTLRFLSDGSVVDAGWSANISCSMNCPPNAVITTTQDITYGSLRSIINCNSNATVTLTPDLIGQALQISGSSILINGSPSINLGSNDILNINSTTSGNTFLINSEGSLMLNNVRLTSTSGSEAIYNQGVLRLETSEIGAQGTDIMNRGTIFIQNGTTTIRNN